MNRKFLATRITCFVFYLDLNIFTKPKFLVEIIARNLSFERERNIVLEHSRPAILNVYESFFIVEIEFPKFKLAESLHFHHFHTPSSLSTHLVVLPIAIPN